jgi:hypothetical protein
MGEKSDYPYLSIVSVVEILIIYALAFLESSK